MAIRQSLLPWLQTNLRHTGVRGVADFALSVVADNWFDFHYGTRTKGRIASDQLNTDSENKVHSAIYQPTKLRPFSKLLRLLSLPKEEVVFVDVGCGKGRVLLLAGDYGFRKIVGVDFDATLCDIARQNIDIFQRKTGRRSDITVVNADVVHYRIQPDENVFFLYNPFDDVVLRRFLGNLRMSRNSHPRPLWLIYHVSIHRDVVEQEPMFVKCEEYRLGGTEFLVYST